MSIDEQFNAAVKVIQSLPKDGFFQPSNEMKLKFYAYFKQATEGPNTTKKPAFYDIVNKYKWDAWKQCGDMSKTEAMKLYVEELKKVIETISLTHEVSQFLDVLEPFYEFLPEEVTNNNNNSNDNNNNNKNNDKITDNDNEQGENNQVTTTTEHPEGFISYDSDGDEFADTIDDIKQSTQSENNVPPPVFRNSFDDDLNENIINYSLASPLNNNNNNNNGNETNRFRNDNLITSTNQINNNNNNVAALGFNEQLAVAIFQLQHSIDRISNRIHIIESKHNDDNAKRKNDNNNNKNNWPFKELSTKTTIFIFTWPVVIFFLMNYLKRFRKK